MASYDYDLFVIGGGSGGVRAARMAAGCGARVGIVDEYRYGGTCVIRGCVPKKLLSYAAHFHEDFEDAPGYGWTAEGVRFDWAALIANKDTEIDRLERVYETLLQNAGVEVYRGRARLTGPHAIDVAGKHISAERILIATGATPFYPHEPGWEHGITSNDAFHLPALPKSIAVCGGGYIAVEFASIFNGLGVETTLIYRRSKILRGFDTDVRETLHAEMAKKGVTFRYGVIVDSIDKIDGGVRLHLSDGETLEVGEVMAATGRDPNVKDLGLDAAGVELAAGGAIRVDAYSKTTQDNIYAIGDVTNRMALTPVAIQEAMAFVDTVYRGTPRAMDYACVPTAVFSHPQVAGVGLTEDQARREAVAIDVYRSTFRPLKHTLSGRDEHTMMKLIVARESGRVLGAHMVGLDAPEIVQGIAVAIKSGATKADFDATVGIHPTAAEEFVTMRNPIEEEEKSAAAYDELPTRRPAAS